MASIVKFYNLSGATDESPPCYILQVDDFKFLLDCGWDEKFSNEMPKELKRHINSIDAVLLSHPDPLHLGGLPYIVGKLGLSCPIYATLPVYKMGQMFMYDLYQSHYNMEDFDLFNLDDVDTAFDRMIQLKYNQTVALKGKGLGLTITPLPAGHMIGGTVWKIVKEGEDDIVYAVDFNHKKERHLNGCEIEKIVRPSVLITDALNADYQQPRRRTRDEKLMTTILSTLRGGGSVLVCVDTAGRVLELAHMLDQLWRNKESGLIAYSLLMLNNVSYNVVEFAKSQIEWMSDKLMRSFEGARNNPFQLKYLQLCHSIAEVQKTPGPKVVLASFPDLECGFARDLFIQWAPHQQNSIVLTTKTGPGTLARDLIDNGGNRTIEMTVKKRVKLEGAELEEFMKTQKLNTQISHKEETTGISSDSESDEELEMSVITGRHDIIVRHNQTRMGSFFKDNRKHHAMYPYHEERTRYDEYGEIIKPEEYRLTEVMDADGETRDIKPESPKPVDEEKEVIIPTKCIVSKKSVQVKAWIQYIELEGRTDGESLMRIVSQLRPRCIIGVRGSPIALKILREHCMSEGCESVHTPSKGETIDATIESHIYQVKLTDALVSNLRWAKSGNLELAWLFGKLATRELPENEVATESERDDTVVLEPSTDVAPHRAAFFNELRLSDLKQALAKHNFATEFTMGALTCCNGTIAIRRMDNGKVSLEGVLSEEYFKVREILYDQFAIV